MAFVSSHPRARHLRPAITLGRWLREWLLPPQRPHGDQPIGMLNGALVGNATQAQDTPRRHQA